MEDTGTQFYVARPEMNLVEGYNIEIDQSDKSSEYNPNSKFNCTMQIKMSNGIEEKENKHDDMEKSKGDKTKPCRQSGFMEIGNVMNLNGNSTPIKVKPKNKNQTNSGLVQNIENVNYFQDKDQIVEKPKSSHTKRMESKKSLKTMKTIKNDQKQDVLPLNIRTYTLTPIPEGQVLKAKLSRMSSFFGNHISIFRNGVIEPLMISQRKSSFFSNVYEIRLPEVNQSNLQKDLDERLGIMEGNFTGSIFNVYEITEGQKILVATIYNEPHVKKFGGARQCKIYLKDRSMPTYVEPKDKNKNLMEIYEQDPQNPTIVLIKTMRPRYNQSTDQYCLPFNSKVPIESSIHNVIMVDSKKKQTLKIYKLGECKYQMNVYYPMTPLVAYAYALTSFTWKWVSQ